MKKPATTLTRKTVFIYKSLKNASKSRRAASTDPITGTATVTTSSTICIDF